ncbi:MULTISPECIES: radical SAM protein [Clostridium]|uniref:radical SAM protein n=1 Tax=Clostridium TaxID=1485 RepID=UPI0008260B75|nr:MULTISPECIES: radical SAM protein [Clostridium]PJI09111.1 radical SAM protein [Clostridium sp. CT7]
MMNFLEKGIKDSLVKAVAKIIDKNPEKNIDKIFAILDKTIKDPYSKPAIESIYNYYKTNETIHEFIQNILTTTDKNCLKKFFANFFGNAIWYGMSRRQKFLDKEDTKVPFVLLISPSMRCTLRCKGCYASKYSKKDDITKEEIERIVKEARDLGIYYVIVLGGEPFINDYMLDIYEKFNDMIFTPFTNGQLITEEIADRLKKCGNVIPMFSLEGFAKETDARRGKGVFKRVMESMDMLKKRGMLFGVSSAVSGKNLNTVTSDEFIDMLIDKGAKMSWYFIYMPVGAGADVNFMLKPDERLLLGRRVRKIRTTKPYFAIDFFNDAPYVGGCIAGKYYCHINSKEDVEPCIFSHFSTFNLKGKPLIEAFRTDFFKELRRRQPYNENMLRPCMMIDNTNVVREVVSKVKAHPTEASGEKMITDKKFMADLDKLASDFKIKADEEWKNVFNGKGNDMMSKG